MALHIFNFDGTDNEPEDALQIVKKGKKEDDNITNILKFHFMAGGNLHDDENKGLSTHCNVDNSFYYQGVGTYGNWWSRLINQGISPEKKDVRTILIKAINDFNRVYQKGDQVIVTGFSRGAALARRFCSKIIEKSPLLNKQTTPFIYLAAFDTVASIGLPNLSKAERPDYEVVFEDGHTISKIIKQATHLVSLDDKRKAFQPTLMNYEESRITELWFAGAHSDVGGGYYRDGLSDLTLSYLINWIAYQVKMFDLLDPELKMPSEKALQKALPLRLKNMIGLDDLQREATALGKNHQQDRWPIVDWLTLEDRVCCVIDKDKLSSKHKPVIHNSITERIAFDKDYRPKSLANVSHNVFFAFKNEPINGYGVKAYCNNPRPVWFALEVGESIEIEVDSAKLFNHSGILVETGEVYSITTQADDVWSDGSIKCNADGWNTDTVQLGLVELTIKLSRRLKRVKSADWFTLCCSVGRGDNQAKAIGCNGEFKASKDGELTFFANDIKSRMANNVGFITINVKRIQ